MENSTNNNYLAINFMLSKGNYEKRVIHSESVFFQKLIYSSKAVKIVFSIQA